MQTTLPHIPKDKQLILFDGLCNFCDNSVQYVIKNDRKQRFLFTSLQGETAQAIVEHFNIDTTKIDSIMLYSPQKKVYYKSKAALKIASKLRVPINLFYVLLIVPDFIRNAVYDYIAKNRYKWYGKKNLCSIPTPEQRKRFLP